MFGRTSAGRVVAAVPVAAAARTRARVGTPRDLPCAPIRWGHRGRAPPLVPRHRARAGPRRDRVRAAHGSVRARLEQARPRRALPDDARPATAPVPDGAVRAALAL